MHRIGRRRFLEKIAAGAAAAPLASIEAAETREGGRKSRVAVAEREGFIRGGRIDRRAVKEAVDALVRNLAGKGSAGGAWRTFVSPRETVAVKFNGLFRRASTSPELVWAVCRGLVDAGLAQERIIVFDRGRKDFDTAGLAPFEDMPRIRFLAADSGWDGEVKAGPVTTRITRVLTRQADAFINLPCLKHHVRSGVTIAMKNHFGSIPNAGKFHFDLDTIAELNALPPIRGKTRLAICDAIVEILDRGPAFHGSRFTWEARRLLASTDFVALDAVGAEMLRKARVAKGFGPTRPHPGHIARAAAIGLGTADLKRIEVVAV